MTLELALVLVCLGWLAGLTVWMVRQTVARAAVTRPPVDGVPAGALQDAVRVALLERLGASGAPGAAGKGRERLRAILAAKRATKETA